MRTPSSAARTAALLALVAAVALAGPRADAKPALIDAINAARAEGCAGNSGVKAPLRTNRKLDAAAQRISRGADLAGALSSSGYRAVRSAAVSISNVRSDADIARTVARRACGDLGSQAVRDIGIERRGKDAWIVLAQPFDASALRNAQQVASTVLKLANDARSRPRKCGRKSFPAAPPLTLANRLSQAARAHAKDLADRGVLDHRGADGSTPAERVNRTGYAWRTVGENVASGPTSAEEVMAGWLASPGHCENLMSPRFTQMGVGVVVDDKSEAGVYWAQVFATPKS